MSEFHPFDGRLAFWLVIGLAVGLYFFFKGFSVYRKCRVMEDTPHVPIRGLAMGLVHIYGEARPGPDGLVSSPVSRSQCLFYKVDIDHWAGDTERGNWRHWKTDWGGTLFTLADTTGQVAINARGADFLIERNTRAVADSQMEFAHPAASLDSRAAGARVEPADKELMEYAESVPGSLDGATGKYRFTEYVVLAGWSYDVLGTYADNPQPVGEQARKLIRKGENDRTYVISSQDQAVTQAELRYRARIQILGGAALATLCLAGLLGHLG